MGRGKTVRKLKKSLPDQCFWVHEGPIVSDLRELHAVLSSEVSEEQFNYHVNEERNDFADWILNVLNDSHCANEVRSAKKLKTVVKRIRDCLKRYE